MRSNFQFIRNSRMREPQRSDLHQCCVRAEQSVYSDPQASVIQARNAVEVLVRYFYTARGLAVPERAGLSDLLGRREFQIALNDRNLLDALHMIRKTGNAGAHGGITDRMWRVDGDDALMALKNLHRVTVGMLGALRLADRVPEYQRPAQPAPTQPAAATTPARPTPTRPAATTTPTRPTPTRPAAATTPARPASTRPAATTTPTRPAATTTPTRPTAGTDLLEQLLQTSPRPSPSGRSASAGSRRAAEGGKDFWQMDLVEPVSAWGGGVLLWLVAFAVASFLLKEEAMARWLPRLYPLAAAVSLFFAYVDRLGEARRRRGLAGEVALTLLPYLPILLGLLDPEPVMVSVLGWQVKALTLFHIATLLPVVIGYFRTDPEAERDRTGHKQRANGRIVRGAFGAAGVCVALSLLFFLLF